MNAPIATATRWRRSLERLVRRFVRWKYVVLTYRDYAARLNRSVEVENVLLACAAGKRDALSKEECRLLAYKIGVPDVFRSPNDPSSATAATGRADGNRDGPPPFAAAHG